MGIWREAMESRRFPFSVFRFPYPVAPIAVLGSPRFSLIAENGKRKTIPMTTDFVGNCDNASGREHTSQQIHRFRGC